ncbi:uncharacterized protein Gasu_27520 [Galdieria sulphuraria]|uniref:Uncharacterized protein n=1 Tax=Galdieria sulphuraria TaxID=130081 RepID=M2Y2D2_GALSU|nr:uncharacterized protein Gasu_27520 [Galdieria sulphuraria]EME29969.1 hypothetical protein Gasu_27520 [Galdieria sulphuraria]|eukprot:XP_005706489.1 hypothetical protein Gasu_27520 [Galdieria sulphuraria]
MLRYSKYMKTFLRNYRTFVRLRSLNRPRGNHEFVTVFPAYSPYILLRFEVSLCERQHTKNDEHLELLNDI